MDIYLGRLNAEQMRAFPAGSPEAKMHGGIPGGAGYWHINVSVFDAASQAQVTGATVEFEYEQLGMGREKKSLEPAVGGRPDELWRLRAARPEGRPTTSSCA